MLINTSRLLLFMCLFSQCAYAVDLAKGVSLYDMQRIVGKRVNLELLVHTETKNDLMKIMEPDIHSGYIYSLYPEHPSVINYEFIEESVDARVVDNRKLQFTESRFDRLYYVIKLNDTGEVIGTSEMYSNGEKDIELSLYVSSKFSRLGIGHEVLGAMLGSIDHMTTAPRTIWESYSNNPGSIALALKNGFERQSSFVNNGRIVRQYTRKTREIPIFVCEPKA